MTIEQFGQQVKQKYPQYQGLSDAELGQRVLEKYPQYQRAISDTPTPAAPATAAQRPNLLQSIGNVALGAAKGVGSTISGIGELGAKVLSPIDKLTGVKPIQSGDAERSLGELGIKDALTPTNTAQKIGFGAEQIGEFFIPGGAAIKGAKAADVAIQGTRLAKTGAEIARGIGLGRKGAKFGANLLEGGAKLGARAGAEALSTGAVTAAQTGGDVKKTLENAALGAAFPLAGAAIGKAVAPVKGFLSSKLPSRFINVSVLKPLEKEFRFGRDPGASVLAEGITANTKDGLFKQIVAKKRELGKLIGEKLGAPAAKGKLINIEPAIAKLDEALEVARKSGEPAYYQRLQAIKKGLTDQLEARGGKLASKVLTPAERAKVTTQVSKLKAERSRMAQGGATRKGLDQELAALEQKLSPEYGKKKTFLSPEEAALLKTQIGEATKWTNQAFDNEVNQARVAVYRKLNDLIDLAVPGTKSLNARYAGMLSAEKSLERTMNIAERHNIIGLSPLIGAGIGATVSVASGDTSPEAIIKAMLVGGLIKGVQSPAVLTRMAQALSALKPEERTLVAKVMPLIKNILAEINTQ